MMGTSMSLFESKPTQFVGIDIGSGGVKLVELRGQNKRPYLYTYAFSEEKIKFRYAKNDEERKALVDETAAIVREVAKAAKTTSTAAVASLPQRDVYSTIITIPQVDPKEFNATIAHEIEKLLPFPLSDAVLDTRKIEPLPSEAELYKKTVRVFITAARKSTIQQYSDIFSKAGFKLQTIETETFATIRAMIGTDPSPVMMIDMGKQYTSFSYIARTIPHVDFVIETGGDKINELLARAWNKTPEDVEQMKMDLFDEFASGTDDAAIEKILEPAIKPIIKEIEIVLETMRRTTLGTITRPDKIILTGGASHCPTLAKKIETHFSIKTYAGDPWARIISPPALKPVLDRIGQRFSVAAGLAERLIIT